MLEKPINGSEGLLAARRLDIARYRSVPVSLTSATSETVGDQEHRIAWAEKQRFSILALAIAQPGMTSPRIREMA
jgi:hypothetical protein